MVGGPAWKRNGAGVTVTLLGESSPVLWAETGLRLGDRREVPVPKWSVPGGDRLLPAGPDVPRKRRGVLPERPLEGYYHAEVPL